MDKTLVHGGWWCLIIIHTTEGEVRGSEGEKERYRVRREGPG